MRVRTQPYYAPRTKLQEVLNFLYSLRTLIKQQARPTMLKHLSSYVVIGNAIGKGCIFTIVDA